MKISGFLYSILFCFLLVPAHSAEISSEETIAEIMIRGNLKIPDETITRLAGIQVGIPAANLALEDLKQKLLQTGKFEWVHVAKRYRSLSRTDQVVLLITVKEKPSAKSKLMFFPILSGSDEYGLNYGISVAAKDLLGLKEKISMPLAWGGIRRAAFEGEFDLHNPIFRTLTAAGEISRKENPHYKKGDFRKEIQVTLQRRLSRFEFNVQSGWTDVRFDARSTDLAHIGAGLVFDTRQDINFPRNAVFAGVSYKRLSILDGGPGYNLYTLDLRGYKGLVGQTILAGQFLYRGANGRLPDYERPFLGGANTLRGYEAGAFTGDSSASASLELRMPLTPLRKIYHAGIDVFTDSGAIYDHGMSLGNAKFKHSAGLGGYFLIMGFGIKADLAYNMHDAFRLHFSTGFRF
jgi:outer membrane protein assembly factor BamA